MSRALVFYGINCCVAHCIGNNSIKHSEKNLEGFRSLQGFKNCKFQTGLLLHKYSCYDIITICDF